MTSKPALNALNFFMADVRDGLGPFLGVYLQSENWSPSQTGPVMTMQGIGAAMSPALGGYVAEKFGYAASFMVLGAVALIALLLWVVRRPMTAEYGGRPG